MIPERAARMFTDMADAVLRGRDAELERQRRAKETGQHYQPPRKLTLVLNWREDA